MKRISSAFFVLFVSLCSYGQFSRQAQDSIRQLTQADYKNMLEQTGISSTRPGPSGTPGQPNSANTDESKAIRYTSLPDPLILNNGKKVKNAKTWWNKRRPEIKELWDKEVYGRVPSYVPDVRWEVKNVTNDTIGKIPVITRTLIGHVDNSSYPSVKVEIDLTVATPANAPGPVPVIMEFGFNFRPRTAPAATATPVR
ncbi:MAG TPA: acetylxylan esterase, partial [Bacteroidales bacterium]|nr:acetylxylan esterase [Bacteroidales bacterium]